MIKVWHDLGLPKWISHAGNVHFCMSLPEVQRRRKRPLGEEPTAFLREETNWVADPCSWLPTWPFSWSFFIIPRFIIVALTIDVYYVDLLLTGVVRPFAAFIQSWLAISVRMNMFSFLGYICWCSICHLNDFPPSKATNCREKGNASKKETDCRQKGTCESLHGVHFLRIVPASREKGWKRHVAPPCHCTSVQKTYPWFCHRNRACMSTISTLGRCSFPTLNGDYWTVGRKTRGRFDIKKSQHGIIQDHLIHNSI